MWQTCDMKGRRHCLWLKTSNLTFEETIWKTRRNVNVWTSWGWLQSYTTDGSEDYWWKQAINAVTRTRIYWRQPDVSFCSFVEESHQQPQHAISVKSAEQTFLRRWRASSFYWNVSLSDTVSCDVTVVMSQFRGHFETLFPSCHSVYHQAGCNLVMLVTAN